MQDSTERPADMAKLLAEQLVPAIEDAQQAA